MAESSDQKLQSELCWCIDQLKISLDSGKLNERQVKETEKAIKTLQNPKAPLVKRRQLMRVKFGDYRSKMENEQKNLKLAEPKFMQKKATSSNSDKAKVFKKRVVLSTANRSNSKCDLSAAAAATNSQESGGGGGFKFNFNVGDEKDQRSGPTSVDKTSASSEASKSTSAAEHRATTITSGPYKSFHFQKSDNSFKFNFGQPS